MSQHCEAEEAELILRCALWLIAQAQALIAEAIKVAAEMAFEECENGGEAAAAPPTYPPHADAVQVVILRKIITRADVICCAHPAGRLELKAEARQLEKRLKAIMAEIAA